MFRASLKRRQHLRLEIAGMLAEVQIDIESRLLQQLEYPALTLARAATAGYRVQKQVDRMAGHECRVGLRRADATMRATLLAKNGSAQCWNWASNF